VTENDITNKEFTGEVIKEDLLSDQTFSKSPVDELARSIVRHDPKKLTQVLLRYI
jgi:hypothetical protein